jgi:hypothetical protein
MLQMHEFMVADAVMLAARCRQRQQQQRWLASVAGAARGGGGSEGLFTGNMVMMKKIKKIKKKVQCFL